MHKILPPFVTQFQPSLPKFDKHNHRKIAFINSKPAITKTDIQGATLDLL